MSRARPATKPDNSAKDPWQDDLEAARIEWAYMRRLWPFVRPYRYAFAVALLILAASFVLEVLGPLVLRYALDGPVSTAIKGGQPDTTELVRLGVAYFAISFGSMALGYAYAMLTAKRGQRVIRDMRVKLFHHLLQQSPRFFDRNPAGKLVTRVTSDVENLSELISAGVLQAVFDLLKIVGILVVLFFVDAKLAFWTLLATPAVIGVSLWFRGLFRLSYREVRGRLARQNAFAAEAIGGVRIARVFGREAAVTARYAELNADTRQAWSRTILHFAAFMASVDACIRATQTMILVLGGHSILAGTLTTGAFVQFWLYFSKLAEPIRELGERYNVLLSAMSSCERIFGIFDHQPAPKDPPSPTESPRQPAHITFEGVSFAYREDAPVLRGISFEVRPGTTTAIVGPTGAGKTTVLALVSRLYDPIQGQVRLDGIPLPELAIETLRRRVAIVPQDVFLFTGSVLDNIRLFDPGIDEAKVEAALERIGALPFVRTLPGGLHAEVQERGATFSLGERQLLAFARALVRDPDLLVLDEATANIDSESEALVQAGLRELVTGRTAIVVAHRLSTVRDADQILVLQKGEVVERGTHEALLRASGVYARMVRAG